MKRLLPIALISFSLCLSNTSLARPHGGRGHHYRHHHHHHHRSHSSFGLSFGFASFYPPYYGAYAPGYYYPYYPYWYSPVAVVPTQTVLVTQNVMSERQNSAETQNSADNYWYYCSKPRGYYPYVLKCSGAWQKVIPHPIETSSKKRRK